MNSESVTLTVEQYEAAMYLKQLKNLEHQDSPECWCFPTLMFVDPDTGMRIFKHYFPH